MQSEQDSSIQQTRLLATVFALASGVVFLNALTEMSATAQDGNDLRAPSAFANIADAQARSRALFSEAAKVIMTRRGSCATSCVSVPFSRHSHHD